MDNNYHSILHVKNEVLLNSFPLDVFVHSVNVANIALSIGSLLTDNKVEQRKVYDAALYHDIGKSKIPPSILHKNGKLHHREWVIMAKHSLYSQELYLNMAGNDTVNKEIGKIIRHHHENWDGSGYPDNLEFDEIPLYSRILKIADVFDAITQLRCYRPFKMRNAIDVMELMKGKELDPLLFEKSKGLLKILLEETYSKDTCNWMEAINI